MVTIKHCIIRHKGILTDNSTKLEVFLPELNNEHDAEIFKLSKQKSAAIIIMDPAFLENVVELLDQAKALLPESVTEREEDDETGFLSPAS